MTCITMANGYITDEIFVNESDIVEYYGNTTANVTDNDGGDGGSMAPPLPVMWHVLEGIIGCLGIAGNGLVLFVFFKNKNLRNLINSFIINQTLIDFTTSFVFILICFLPAIPLDPSSTAHLIFCQIWVSEYILWALFISSSHNLVCITLDRFYAIIYPARYRRSSTKIQSRIKLIAVLTWSSGFILDCYWPAIHIILSPPGICIPSWPNKVAQGVIGVFIFFVTYAGPLGVMAFSYVRILSKMRKQSARATAPAPMPSNPTPNSTSVVHVPKRTMSERSSKASRNIIKTMVSVSLTYAICWAPIAFNYLVYNLGGPLDFFSVWYAVTKVFVYVNMCANPVIYTMQYQQFQRAFERTFNVRVFKGLPDSTEHTKSASADVKDLGDESI